MRQRNDSGSVLHVSAWPTDQEPDRAPFDVGPGEEKDFPQLLAGFTSLEPDEPEPAAAAAEPAAQEQPAPSKPKSRSRNTDTADAAEGGEPR